ncbi:conserved hypothetical protein [Escherichia coli M605]|uniref:Uncharacterized protein n=1 Tax=Escherichia coli M605 TaxID=656417 RepID=F4SXQ2_ECOLX|nr:conserved hypothetical protein [Escherichia coli M605]OSK79764.1 hypothetical protein EAAG_03591 [Escherichia coli H001]
MTPPITVIYQTKETGIYFNADDCVRVICERLKL